MSTLIQLQNAVIKPISSSSTPIFKNAVSLTIKSDQKWAIIGPTKTPLLKTLASQFIASPPLSRTYPFLHRSTWPSSVIQFLEFKGVLPTAHLSARYEFFKDEFDETTRRYVVGNTNNDRVINYGLLDQVFEKLKLQGLENRWVMGLSNGQTRRARLARALLREPKVLIVDDPFLGLDPVASGVVSEVLNALPPDPFVIVGLRWQDEVPDWITHVAVVDETGIVKQGSTRELEHDLKELQQRHHDQFEEQAQKDKESIQVLKGLFKPTLESTDSSPHIEFRDINIAYRGQPVLQDLNWKVEHGEKWHIQGNNGTGKSTLLSLITAEHPQSWNSSIVIRGKPRRTGVQSFFDINESIGFASPELHSIYPSHHTVYDALATGYLVGSWVPPKDLSTDQIDRIETYLKEFDLSEKRDRLFGELGISDQKVVLFIRSLIKNPDLVILDEALSVMDDNMVEKCKELLRHYPGTVLAIGHMDSEVPDTDRYLRLIGPGQYEVGEKK
jgi:ABC-type molybdenum transport system ATPase subunit/photorepair protein PhrA